MNTTALDLILTQQEALSPLAAMNVAAIKEQWARETRVAVDGKAACQIVGCGPSQLANKVRVGVISSFLDGCRRLYLTETLYRHVVENVVKSHPLGGEPLKARHPKGQFQKGHTRQPSAAQREALRKGNALRISRARNRKATKETATTTA
jgi:hypothetical protein